MKRLSSHFIITETAELLKNSVVELSDNKPNYLNIFDNIHESAHTLFYDGIISPPIISLNFRNISKQEIQNKGYKHASIYDLISGHVKYHNKYIFDFETEDLSTINKLINTNFERISSINSIEFIMACTVLPRIILGETILYNRTRLLWSGTNLLDKKITGQTAVSLV